jgi:hypothetical protein
MLMTKDVPYEWHDGVALVAQLLAQLRAESTGMVPTDVPDLRDLALDETGWLVISYEETTLPAMPGAAQLLQQLLSGRDQPPQLRLFVMQSATSEAPTPLDDFADELAKWERPNRIPKLVSLYTRAFEKIGADALSEEAMARERELARVSRWASEDKVLGRNTTTPAAVKTAKAASGSKSTFVLGSLIVLAAVLLAAAEWQYVVDRFVEVERPEVTTEAAVPEPPAPDPEPARPAGPRTEPRPTPPTPSARLESRSEAPRSADLATAENELAKAQELFNQQDYARARAAFARILESLRNEPSLQAEQIRQAARSLEEVARAAVVEPAVGSTAEYRNGDTGVVAPVPQVYLPPKPDPRTPAEKLQVMEVRINTDGRVDSAKFVINRPSFRNSWWTSAAKAWRFVPASKDGQPVRYVMRIVMDDSDSPH